MQIALRLARRRLKATTGEEMCGRRKQPLVQSVNDFIVLDEKTPNFPGVI